MLDNFQGIDKYSLTEYCFQLCVLIITTYNGHSLSSVAADLRK